MSNSVVLYSEAKFSVFSKPRGITTGDFVNVMKEMFPICAQEVVGKDFFKYNPVHRLDKDTSGCLIVSKQLETCQRLMEAFKKRTVKKQYLAIVCGRPAEDSGEIDVALHVENLKIKDSTYSRTMVNPRGKQAITRYQVLFTNGEYSLLNLQPLTGRTHQLRVHCQSVLKTPILGDPWYNPTHNPQEQEMFLHAYRIAIPQEATDEMLKITAPLPSSMVKRINAISGRNMTDELGLS